MPWITKLILAASVALPAVLWPQAAHAAGTNTPHRADEAERRWVTHVVILGERITDIATRYAVTSDDIKRWNRKVLGDKGWIYARQKLRIYARRVPPPREKITYRVKKGDSWIGLARRFRVRTADLQAWNPRAPKSFTVGTALTVYTTPRPHASSTGSSHAPNRPAPSSLPQIESGGLSVGSPNQGRLLGGVPLPKSPYYDLRKPHEAYGSSHAVKVVVQTLAAFHAGSRYRGKLTIGAMSTRTGGAFGQHRSHQSGRDIDIRLPLHSNGRIDWDASWQLVKAFIDSGQVEYIFLSTSRQRFLYQAAKRAKTPSHKLKRWMQYPGRGSKRAGIVRHAEGHTEHIHVRIQCGPNSPRCR